MNDSVFLLRKKQHSSEQLEFLQGRSYSLTRSQHLKPDIQPRQEKWVKKEPRGTKSQGKRSETGNDEVTCYTLMCVFVKIVVFLLPV